jgi:hypothetical protein
MSLILGVTKSLSLEDVPQVTSTVVADDLRPHHTKTRVRLLSHRTWYGIPECGPSAARVELVVCFVEGRIASSALVDTGVGVVLVVSPGTGHLCALLSQNAELLYGHVSNTMRMRRLEVDVPGDSCACHSPSGFCTG